MAIAPTGKVQTPNTRSLYTPDYGAALKDYQQAAKQREELEKAGNSVSTGGFEQRQKYKEDLDYARNREDELYQLSNPNSLVNNIKAQQSAIADYETALPSTKDQYLKLGESIARKNQAKSQENIAEDFNSRGLLGGGMSQKAALDQDVETNSAIADYKLGLDSMLKKQLSGMKDNVAKMSAVSASNAPWTGDLQLYDMESDIKNYLQDIATTADVFNGLGSGIGQGIGIAAANKGKK